MAAVGRLELTNSWKQENEIMTNYIKENAAGGGILQILEAGCGRTWDIDLDGVEYVLTGVDIDKPALDARKNIVKDLHVTVEGDLRSVELREQQYDVVFNSYVLEHIDGAEQVLNNFFRWIKPTGIVVIRIPDPDSVQGFVTRVTPHWFHVLYYRLLGSRNAGKPGYGPYPVYYDPVVSRNGIRDYCSRKNVAILAEYGDAYFRPGRGVLRLLIHSAKQVVSLLSFGQLSARHTNLLYVLQKRK